MARPQLTPIFWRSSFGIVPMSTQTPDSIVMAGASVAIAPSGGLNPGNQSISGQREDAIGFIVNGGDVKELMNGGTTIIPNLDSIAEFRVLTNNFDAGVSEITAAEFIVNVITKSGGNALHGTACSQISYAIRISTRATSSSPDRSLLPAEPVRAVFAAGRSGKTRFSTSATIRERAPIQGIDTGSDLGTHAWLSGRATWVRCRRIWQFG